MSSNKHESRGAKNRLDIVISSYAGDAEPAKKALASPDPKSRASALLALHRLGMLDDRDLEAALDDHDPQVRRRACELTASYSAISLAKSLADPDPYVVEMALWSSGERAESRNLEIIRIQAIEHPESLVREAAVAALGAIGDPSGLTAILAALEDRPNVRRRAAVALAAFEGEQVNQALRKAANDRDWQTRQIAEDLLEITEGSVD